MKTCGFCTTYCGNSWCVTKEDDVLALIVSLCQFNIGSMNVSIEKVANAQLDCQQYYIKCFDEAKNPMAEDYQKTLRACVLKKDHL